jgi:vacuolar-type H+-ATPase catalytic subunit A/Vma1
VLTSGVVGGGVLALKPADNHRLSVIGVPDDQQIGHAIHLRIGQQILQSFEDALGLCVSDPVRLQDAADSLL